MASIGHIAVGMAAGRFFSADRRAARNAAVIFSVVSLAPDADAIGFRFGVRYADTWGHRGASHSLAVALAVAAVAWIVAKRWGERPAFTALLTGIVVASHGLLDTMTFGGGLGCALLWPFSDHRYWAPLRFIPVAPIGIGMISLRGLYVIAVESVIFAPFFLYYFVGFGRLTRRR